MQRLSVGTGDGEALADGDMLALGLILGETLGDT